MFGAFRRAAADRDADEVAGTAEGAAMHAQPTARGAAVDPMRRGCWRAFSRQAAQIGVLGTTPTRKLARDRQWCLRRPRAAATLSGCSWTHSARSTSSRLGAISRTSKSNSWHRRTLVGRSALRNTASMRSTKWSGLSGQSRLAGRSHFTPTSQGRFTAKGTRTAVFRSSTSRSARPRRSPLSMSAQRVSSQCGQCHRSTAAATIASARPSG